MKPALVYYGGKQNMLPYIIPLVPEHGCYVEPFCGGATVFFAKKKSSVEVLNDNSDILINFYRILQDEEKGKKLLNMCKGTLYSRTEHTKAIELFKTGSETEKAWALWFKINTGFFGKLDGGFSITKVSGSSPCMKFNNYKKNLFQIANRLQNVEIENIDALDCIDLYDRETSFFYLDPPYLDADQGHYKGYTGEKYYSLLNSLSKIKGNFLLSCYPGNIIKMFIEKEDWSYFSIKQQVSTANRNHNKCRKKKTEMLVWNYDKALIQQKDLFGEAI